MFSKATSRSLRLSAALVVGRDVDGFPPMLCTKAVRPIGLMNEYQLSLNSIPLSYFI